MFSAIRKRISWVNVAMTLALVFAMTGGAYAAKKYLITSTKQISPSVLKQLQGKAGAPGAQGAQGPAGSAGKGEKGERGEQGLEGKAGKDGTNGTNGKDGTNGVGATSKVFTGQKTHGSEECEEGGLEVTSASGTSLVCNGAAGSPGVPGKEGKAGPTGPTGPQGSPWTVGGKLPSNQSEKGTWAVSGTPVTLPHFSAFGEVLYTSVSFPIPLNEELEEANVHIIQFGEGEGEASQAEAITNGECKGTVTSPAAGITGSGATATGNLCIFVDGGILVSNIGKIQTFGLAGKTGVVVFIHPAEKEKAIVADGTWAVMDAQ